MKLDDFVSATNLASYQRMLDDSRDEAQRKIIRKLMAQELAKHRPTAPRTRGNLIFHAKPEA